jgi:hypothetical protein
MQATSLCGDFAVGTNSDESVHVAVTIFAAQRNSTSVFFHCVAHQRRKHSPFLPAETIAPEFWSTPSVFCHSRTGAKVCCQVAVVNPSSPGRHMVIGVHSCKGHAASSLGAIAFVNASFAVQARGFGGRRYMHELPVVAELCERQPSAESTKASVASICLGPIFGGSIGTDQGSSRSNSSGRSFLSRQRRRVWETWLDHNRRNGIDRTYAYGLDGDATQFFSSRPDVVFSQFPAAWHERAQFPLVGDASLTARLSVSNYYLTQGMTLQKCFVDHGAETEWLLSIDTDEFWRGPPLGAHLTAASSQGKKVLSLCRGQVDPQGYFSNLAAQKYAIRPAGCRDPTTAYAWIHYGSCGSGDAPSRLHRDAFDRTVQHGRCATHPRQPYLDHGWRACFFVPPINLSEVPETCRAHAEAIRSTSVPVKCDALACYPRISYSCTGACGREQDCSTAEGCSN